MTFEMCLFGLHGFILILAIDSWRKGSNTRSIRWPLASGEFRKDDVRPLVGASAVCFLFFSDLTLFVR